MQTKKTSNSRMPSIGDINKSQFGMACKNGKLIRNAFSQVSGTSTDPTICNRLTAKMHRVIKSDEYSYIDYKCANYSDLTILRGFDFFTRKQMHQWFRGNCDTTVDRPNGECLVHIPPFCPEFSFKKTRCDHFKFIAAAALFDFEKLTYTTNIKETNILYMEELVEISLQPTFKADSDLPLVVVLGLQFYTIKNHVAYLSGQGGFTSMSIIHTDQIIL